jgi:(p)ppGpp synthase/HD superfamily hydrolase
MISSFAVFDTKEAINRPLAFSIFVISSIQSIRSNSSSIFSSIFEIHIMIVVKAEQLARTAHQGQFRKYTGEPYIVHPEAVANIVASVTDDPVMLAAAWLHDVVEDTNVTIDMIEAGFGPEIASVVADVTNITKKSDGNRQYRKGIERQHLAGASPKAKTVKLADILHNVPDIIRNDPGFARTYVAEKQAVLEVLIGGDERLYAAAKQMIDEFVRSC